MSKTITKVIAGLGIVAGLGVAALPLSSYAADASSDVTVSFKVNSVIDGNATICSAGTTPSQGTVQGGQTATVICEVGYSSNGGASVSIVDKDANSALIGTGSASNTIPAFSTTANQASLTAGTAGWGYKFSVNDAGAVSNGLIAITNAANYNGVPTGTALTVGSNTGPVADAIGTFTFGVQTATTTPADTYEDTVTIAITAAV